MTAAPRRARLDAELVRRGLAPSRTAARAMVEAGEVIVDRLPTPKPASQVTPDQGITVQAAGPRYASRGGRKLDGALDDLHVDPQGLTVLDAGAAHGGFTDVLLRRGAAHVVAVDVAYGQMAWALREDPRVTLLERTNVRHLTRAQLGGRVPDLVVADLSFISLAKVIPALAAVAAATSAMLPMVKPQFEAGPADVGRGGVVRDPAVRAAACRRVADAAGAHGFGLVGAAPSRTPGPAGNVEFFLHLRREGGTAVAGGDVDAMIAEAVAAGDGLAQR